MIGKIELSLNSFIVIHDDLVNKPSFGCNFWSMLNIPEAWLEENRKRYPKLNIRKIKISDILVKNNPREAHIKSVLINEYFKMKQITRVCDNCSGGGETSRCCDAEIENNKCLSCNKFAASVVCMDCNGSGYYEWFVGQQVKVYVGPFTGPPLKQFFRKKSLWLPGKILSTYGKSKVKIKLRRADKPMIIHVNDLEPE